MFGWNLDLCDFDSPPSPARFLTLFLREMMLSPYNNLYSSFQRLSQSTEHVTATLESRSDAQISHITHHAR